MKIKKKWKNAKFIAVTSTWRINLNIDYDAKGSFSKEVFPKNKIEIKRFCFDEACSYVTDKVIVNKIRLIRSKKKKKMSNENIFKLFILSFKYCLEFFIIQIKFNFIYVLALK